MEVHAVVDLVVFFCAVVICCFGNCLVMISVRRFEYLKESAFYFVALLAFYDFCHGAPLFVVSATLSILDSALVDITIAYQVLCRIQGFLAEFATLGDMLSILIISIIDRFVYIYWPLSYRTIVTEKRTLIINIFSAVFVVPVSAVLASVTVVEKPCTTYQMVNSSGMTYVIGVLHVVVLAIVVGVYITIAVVSRRVRRRAPNNHSALEESKMTRTLVRVIGIFIATNVTFIVIYRLTVNRTGNHIVWIQLTGYWIWEVRIIEQGLHTSGLVAGSRVGLGAEGGINTREDSLTFI